MARNAKNLRGKHASSNWHPKSTNGYHRRGFKVGSPLGLANISRAGSKARALRLAKSELRPPCVPKTCSANSANTPRLLKDQQFSALPGLARPAAHARMCEAISAFIVEVRFASGSVTVASS